MAPHPYRSAPPTAFWSRSVTRDFAAAEVAAGQPFTIDRADRFMSAGSCFASHVRQHVEARGFAYTVTERAHPMFTETAEAPYYEAFSARYGNIYTAAQMAQILDRALGGFSPVEDHWLVDGRWVDPYRPGLRHHASCEREFHALTAQHLAAVRRAVESSTVFVFTLGLTEAWTSADDGAVFPACPGTVAGTFDPERHVFVNFTVDAVVDDLLRTIDLARAINPSLKIVLTVSPVPLVATASGRHVLVASTFSKSVLRVAADIVAGASRDVAYFPSYELVTGPQAAGGAYEEDRRNVREPAVAAVMDAFFAAFYEDGAGTVAPTEPGAPSRAARLAAVAVEAECEEEMADRWEPARPR